jgi:fructose-specific phosphotransferase system IIC component
MNNIMNHVRRYLYPFDPRRPNEWRGAFILLVIFGILSFCVRISGKWTINGIVPVKGYLIWAFINLYLLGGVVWELLKPVGDETAAMSMGKRVGLVCAALVAVATSLVVVWIK